MSNTEQFSSDINTGYSFEGDSIVLGGAMLDGQNIPGLQIKAPLRMFNRHGLVAGATGTGKTKTLQALAESLSNNGVSVLMMDIKGDLSGISQAGSENPKITDRVQKIGFNWKAQATPTEFLSISKENGTKMRATISEFGPVLLNKILEFKILIIL
jgi:hypothetical protein